MVKTYTITGATGNIGRLVAEKLIGAGTVVRVIGRDATKLKSLVDKGAQALVGDLGDTTFLTKAYSGADAVFAMIPPNMASKDTRGFQNKIAESHVTAISAAKVHNVVVLSSMGADLEEGAGIVQGLHDFERHVKKLTGVNVLVLRPAYFLENLWMQLDMIQHMGIVGTPLRADVSIPMVASADIAEVVSKAMSSLTFKGHSVSYVLGQRDLSYGEVTKILGKAIGKPDLQYVQFPREQAIQGMVQMGLSEDVAKNLVELSEGINSGKVKGTTRTAQNTTTTTIEAFADGFARAFAARGHAQKS